MYLAVTITLYVSAGSLLGLLFQVIDISFPDQLNPYVDPYSTGIRLAIASLIVIFPVYLFLTRYLSRDVRSNPVKRELPIRKWLTYLTLFLAGALIIGDLVALINTFLSGEITMRFGLKVLAILVVAGYAFGYYIYSLRHSADMTPKAERWFAVVPAIFVLLSVIGGFFIMGSPVTQRKLRFDTQRVNELQMIQSYLITFYERSAKLPSNLEELNTPVLGFVLPKDPESEQNYEYEVVSPTAFRLCANFSLPSQDDRARSYPKFPGLSENENWQHDAGRVCFDRAINPDLLPSGANAKAIPTI